MASSVRIAYKSSVRKDIRRLDKQAVRRLLNRIERDLTAHPDAGIPLSGEFKGIRKHRVGEYRILYTRTADGILILRIAHRREAYR